jgi:hypothetical protein
VRASGWVIAATAGVVLACGGSTPEVEEPVEVEPDELEPEPEPEAPVAIAEPLQALFATSNRAEAEALLDQDADTGWRPTQDAAGEGVLLRFERPRELKSVHVQTCGDSAELGLYVNGASMGSKQGADVSFEMPSGEVRSVFVKILRGADACLSEIVISDGTGPLFLGPPRRVEARVEVSSTLEPSAAYHETYLFDGRQHFAWVEGAKGSGDGESIQINLKKDQAVSAVEIYNGYHRSKDHFEKNARVRKLEIEAQGRRVMLDVADGMAPRRLDLDPPLAARTLTLTVAASQKGSAYEDLAISELRFFDREGPFTISPSKPKDLEGALHGALEGKPLGEVVGKTFRQVCGGQREFKLRWDHSFVYYELDETSEHSREVILDGAWVPGKGGIKLYGRESIAEQEFTPYGTVPPEDSERVTGGDLTIESFQALGEEGLKDLLANWSKMGANDRVECLINGRAPDMDALQQIVGDRQVIVVHGKAITDILVHNP